MAIEYLLLESGDNILLEDGVSLFLLESSSVTGEVSPTSLLRIDSWEFDSLESNPADRDPISYYISWQTMDMGSENIDKRLEAIRVTGKTSSDGKVQIHAFQQGEEIDRSLIDSGTTPTYEVDIPDATVVTRHRRIKGGCKNMALFSVRVSGEWDGLNAPDRIDEIIAEITTHGTKK